MELDELIKIRKSVRHFKSKTPDWRQIIEAIDAALKIPLAGNIPSVKFILVDDKKIISKLADAAQQDFIRQVKYVVVVVSDSTDVVRSYDERGEKYTTQQAGAAIEQFWLKLLDFGLSTCWVGAFVDDQVKVALQIPDNIEVEAILPIGYDMGYERKKTKPSLDRSLRFNSYHGKFMKPRKEVEAF